MNTLIQTRLDEAFRAVFTSIERNVAQAKSDVCPFNEEAWQAICSAEHARAKRGCGLSWSYYVDLFSSAIDGHSEKLPKHHHARAYEIATQDWCYETRTEREQTREWNSENGCCSHGITLGCCPAGCGS